DSTGDNTGLATPVSAVPALTEFMN
ncbi:hypothetical protein L195_g057586, partial [Trifolium pratense]